MVKLQIQVSDFKESEEMLARLRAMDLTNWFKGTAATLMRNRFRDIIEKGVDRGSYPPLHPQTLARKQGRGKVLVDSGKLIDSISKNTTNSIFNVSKNSLEIGSKLPYARIQNEGGTIPVSERMRGFLHTIGIHLKSSTGSIKIPKREYLIISQGFERQLNNSLISFIQRNLIKEG